MPHFLTDDGVTIVYDDLGPRDGTPVAEHHGLAAAGEQLGADAAFLAGRGHRVLVPDLRGHGRSGKPDPMDAEAFGIPRMAGDLVAMLDHAEVASVHWVGNSLGGIVALEMLPRHESRLRTLATFGTAYALGLPRWSAQVIPWSYALLGPTLNARLTARATTRRAEARPLIARLVAQFDPAVGLLVARNLTRYDLIANALGAGLPILMLRGGRDTQVNAALGPTLKAMRSRPNFTLAEVPEGGHCANLDATEAVRTALLRFWEEPATFRKSAADGGAGAR